MFVDAVVRTSTQNNILVVPVAAVLRDDKNEPIVYVQAEPGKFAQRSVATGPQQNDCRHHQWIAGGRNHRERRKSLPPVRQRHSIEAQTA